MRKTIAKNGDTIIRLTDDERFRLRHILHGRLNDCVSCVKAREVSGAGGVDLWERMGREAYDLLQAVKCDGEVGKTEAELFIVERGVSA